jgi:hypothetical protein
MTAASVSGVGSGGAEGSQKGSSRMTLGVDHLIGTRVVKSGSVALTSGTPSTATVVFESTLSGAATDYMVIACPVGATAAIAAAGVAVSGLTTSQFVLTGQRWAA